MRSLSLVLPLLVCAGCVGVVARPPPGMTISIRGTVQTSVSASGQVRANVPVVVAPPAPAVAIVGAPVVEFFGIPLEGAQDVVFVLDCSGSMTDPARGRLAQIAVPVVAPPPPVPQPPPPPPPQPGDPAVIPGYSDPPLTTSPPLTSPPPMRPEEQTPPPIVQPAPAPAPVLPRKFDIAQAELIDAVRQLPDGTRINVIFFNSDLQAVATELVTLQANDRDPLVAFIMDRVATGSTALTPAMRMAFLMNARRIVLLSDGLGNVGGSSGALLRDAREAVRGGVRIDAIGLGDDQDARLLHTLATESGGLYQRL